MNELDAALEPASAVICSMLDRWPGPRVLVVLLARPDVRQELLQFWFTAKQRDAFTVAARLAGWDLRWRTYERGWDIGAWEELHEGQV